MKRIQCLLVLLCWVVGECSAQTNSAQTNSEPRPLPLPPPIQAPRDKPYPGTLTLVVDATDVQRRILRFRESIPVASPGPFVLLYPQWLPGVHGPAGVLRSLSGLKITAGGRAVQWKRDTVDVFAYRVDVPAGATTLDVEGQFLTPTDTPQGAVTMSTEIVRLNWYTAALYPAGYFMRRIPIEASVQLPQGWQFATALETASSASGTVKFKSVSFEVLADSPLIAGQYFKTLDLDPGGRSRVTLNIAADEAALLEVSVPAEHALQELVHQADLLYGARHFNHYDFLLTLSDKIASSGLEHHRSSDNGTNPKYFTTWDTSFISRDLLAHEFNHSWDGKFRRPADLWTPNLNVPMRDSLLWVYEGQTQYYGQVLAARAGFLSKQQALDALATTIATIDARKGRAWRNLQDTSNDPIITSRRPVPWQNWQRNEDYYSEGLLVWLEVDTLIRQRSSNKHSLDDFARAFFGVRDGDWGEITYTFADIVAALNKVEPYDWAALLRTRLEENASTAPLEGLKRGGYELTYAETPTDYFKNSEVLRKVVDLSYSLGAVIDSKGKVTVVMWESAAFKAGLISGMEMIAVNSTTYDSDRLRAVVKGSKQNAAPIELLVKQGDSVSTLRVDYHDGARYPQLTRLKDAPALLDDILAPR